MDYVRGKVERYAIGDKKTLEVGSRNYNGTVRSLFSGEYIGVDMEDGADVDLVARADALPFPDESFDVVITTEMLEHDPFFWLSLPEMARVLRPEGFLLLTTRGINFHLHGYPDDYWRFTESAIDHLFQTAGLQTIEVVPDWYPDHSGVFGLAQK